MPCSLLACQQYCTVHSAVRHCFLSADTMCGSKFAVALRLLLRQGEPEFRLWVCITEQNQVALQLLLCRLWRPTAAIQCSSMPTFVPTEILRHLHIAPMQLLIPTCACAGQWLDQGGPVVAPDHASVPACEPPAPGLQQLLSELPGPCCGDAQRAAALPHSLHSLCGGRLGRQLPVQPSAFCGRLRCAAQGLPSCISQAMHWS